MTIDEINEASAVLTAVLNTLLGMIKGGAGTQAVAPKNAIGTLLATAADTIASGVVGAPLLNCFNLVQQYGVTRVQMDTVRALILNYSPSPITIPGVAVAVTALYFCLLEQAIIVANTTFVSRQDVDQMILTMNKAFEPAEEFSADVDQNPAVYQQLLSLHAAVTQDLVVTARPLPRIVVYDFGVVVPSLYLANRIYSDGGRADDLVAENKVVNPLFMPPSGRCLSQ